MIAAPKEEISGKCVVVEWLPSKEHIRVQRINPEGKMDLRVRDPGIAGHYNPCAFPIVVHVTTLFPKPLAFQSTFTVGDRVQIDPKFTVEELKIKQKHYRGYVNEMGKVRMACLQ